MMKAYNGYNNFWGRENLIQDAAEYAVDWWQRAALFTEIMHQRGNMYLDHVKAGQPPVLVFDYEMVLDGRTFTRPVNYAVVRITGGAGDDSEPPEIDPGKRPIVVIDPRAGHGPGIGGSKLDSQIGVALNAGHPVYFVMFFPEPEPGQTMADVQAAEVAFLEEVNHRHPEAEPPAVIGNCQAGWATALIGADRPDVTGPMVFNGSPLSYWGGVDGANPMRYRGGLVGGVWLTSLFCDLGNGIFDGAHLVSNFEDLNPANTLWTKQYNVWANVDTEEERYLSFEKWWGGFFKMNREEVHFIVESLFVGNELEQGTLRLSEDKAVNLKNFKDPIVVFASAGDNITPPQQALNWIYKVYETVDEIKRNGQVIVYIVHPKIGHLGIFVGSKVARKEHTAIIGTVDMIEYLAPGLYEMVIIEGDKPGDGQQVEFHERTMTDILELDDGLDDETAFDSVAAVSRFNDRLYLTFGSPWVRMMTNDWVAETVRQLHPLRVQRYMFSDLNPWMWPLSYLANQVKQQRRPAAADNSFMAWEKDCSSAIQAMLDRYRDKRDAADEKLFKFMYENSWMKTLFGSHSFGEQRIAPVTEQRPTAKLEEALWADAMVKGGFAAAVVRIVLAVAGADGSIDQREYAVAQMIIQTNDRLKHLKPADLKRITKEQAALVEHDLHQAIDALPALLPKKSDREEVFEIANSIAAANLQIDKQEQQLLDRIKAVLTL
jgi:tellurite resistance protein